MKKIFAQYPSVFYQILLLFTIEQICFSCFSFNLYRNLNDPANGSLLLSLPFLNCSLYFLSGLTLDHLDNPRKSLTLGASFLLLGIVVSSFAKASEWSQIGAIIFLYFGNGIFLIYCLIHIGLFFPVANDWKDNAFRMFFGVNILFHLLLSLTLVFLPDQLFFILNSFSVIPILGFFFWILLLYLIRYFKDIGFSIEGDEEPTPIKKESSVTWKMMLSIIGVVFIFSFISHNLHQLGNINLNEIFLGQDGFASFINDLGVNEFTLIDTFLRIIVVIGIIVAIYFAKFHSTHFYTINIIFGVLMVMACLEWGMLIFGNYYLDFALEMSYDYISSFLIIPIFLSIMTHINVDKNLGFWVGGLLAMPSLVMSIEPNLLVSENNSNLLPHLALILLIVMFIAFRENKDFLKEKLRLNESNRDDDNDGEEDIDIIKHLVEK